MSGIAVACGLLGARRRSAPPVVGAPSCAAVVLLGVATTVTATIANATAAELFVNGASAGAMAIAGSTASIAWTPDTDDETTSLVVRATKGSRSTDSSATVVDAQDWLEYWTADAGLVAGSGDLVTWTGRRAGLIIQPGANAPAVVSSFAGRSAAAVQCVVASSESFLAPATAAGVASGDDTAFTVVCQHTFDGLGSGETLLSFGAVGDATRMIRYSGTGAAAAAPVGRGTGDATNVTGSPTVTVGNATEYVLRYSRTAAGARIGLGTTYTDSACAIGDLGTRDLLSFGAMRRDTTVSAYCDCTIRRILVRAGTYSDARLTALRNLFHGT